MLTRIFHNSERLGAFFDQLELTLYQPQRHHILNMADALLVCEDDKTLAALQLLVIVASVCGICPASLLLRARYFLSCHDVQPNKGIIFVIKIMSRSF